MGITKRKNGYYYLYTKTPNGSEKRISLETKNERLAQEIYNAFLLDKVKQKLSPKETPIPITTNQEKTPKSSSPPIAPVYNQYLDYIKDQQICEPVYQAKVRLLKLLKDNKIVRIQDITPQNISKLIKGFSKIGVYTAETHIRNIKAFLNYLIKKGVYSRSDYEMLSFPPKKQSVRDITIPKMTIKSSYKQRETGI